MASPIHLEYVLKTHFGFDSFRKGQKEVIECLLAGRHSAAIFPTGSGKSLCYQLTALLLPGLTVVISPLLALMKDQIDQLKARNISAERLDSTLDESAYRSVLDAVRNKQLKLLFIAPERLNNERFLALIRGQQISLLAVDEAHCISAWGHNFRPEYLKIASISKTLKVERVLALTATATPQVSADIASSFDIRPSDVVNTGFHRPNLELLVSPCASADRTALLIERIKSRLPGSTIVYVMLQRHAEEVANALVQAGFKARPYHAGMKDDIREATQEAFMRGEVPIICATIAFGMGVDKSDIRYIYHYHLSKGYESYMQEIGRAGRDGQPAICELLACADDRIILENFAYGDTPDRESIESLVTEIFKQPTQFDVSIYDLSKRHDIRQLVVNTLLVHLELMGHLRSEGHFYDELKYAPKQTSKDILSNYGAKQADFLKLLFQCSSKAKKWLTLDVEKVICASGHARDVILRAFSDLEEKGFIELQLSGYRHRFHRTTENPDIRSVCTELEALFSKHEQMEINRVNSMLEYASVQECLTAKLLHYFGESIPPCGHCSHCSGKPSQPLPVSPLRAVNSSDLATLQSLAKQHPQALARPRQQARFLCGLNSPATSGVREVRGHPLFGTYEEIPFAHILKTVS